MKMDAHAVVLAESHATKQPRLRDGAAVSSSISRHTFTAPGGVVTDSWAFGEAFGQTSLDTGTLKSYSRAWADATFIDPNERNDDANVTAWNAVSIGDRLTTTTASGAPFIGSNGATGSFNMTVSGLTGKEHVLKAGTTSRRVHLRLTTVGGKNAYFDWHYGIGEIT